MKRLNDIPDKNPFRVPDNYFEEVNRKIISATSGFDKDIRRVSIYNRFRSSLLIAASVAGLILISYTAFKLLTGNNKSTQLSEVFSELSPDSYINDIDMISLEKDVLTTIPTESLPDVSKKDIIDYLLLDNIEINDIYEQL